MTGNTQPQAAGLCVLVVDRPSRFLTYQGVSLVAKGLFVMDIIHVMGIIHVMDIIHGKTTEEVQVSFQWKNPDFPIEES